MKKILSSIILILVVIAALSTISNAAALQATISITPDKTEVNPGDSVTFTLKLINGDDVGAASGVIQYDTNFFESMTHSSGIGINTGTGKFSMFVTPGEPNIGTFTLKVKSTATGTGNVKFTELEASDSEDIATTPDVSIDIKIKETTEQPSTNPGTTGGNTEEKPSTDQDPTKSPTTDEDPTKSPTNPGSTDSPSTGDSKGETQSPTTDGDENKSPVTGGDSTGNQANNEQQNPTTGVAQDGNKDQTQNEQKPATNEEQKANSSNEVKSSNDNTASKTALPNTGLPTGIIAVAVVGIVAGIFYTRLKKYKDVK
ncbi:MAG: hypothetical protein IJV31_06605 [Clostridia bacterium]|nr:hypothetical protein [Clostridia bacterium]